MSVKITCINKDGGDHYDPHEAITYLGWVNESTGKKGRATKLEMVDFIEKGNQAYVQGRIKKVYLEVKTSSHGNKYVRTIPDNIESNNLLSLPEC
jgi:hypothetical protein